MSERNKDKPETLDEAELQAHPQFASTLANGLAVLGCFTNGSPVQGNKDLAEQLGMSRPTISRLTFTLVGLGYLRRDQQTGKYSLGPAVLSLGYPLLSQLMIRRIGGPAMLELANYAQGPVSVGTRDRLQVIYVETVQGPLGNDTKPGIGSTRPFLQTAMGRALLYGLEPQEQAMIIARLQQTQKENWEKYSTRLKIAFEEIESRGFCIVSGEWRPTLAAVAVPMRKQVNGMPLALNLTVPIYATSQKQLETDLGPRLLGLVHQLESLMGIEAN